MEGGGKMIGLIGAIPVLAGMMYTSANFVDERYHHERSAKWQHTKIEGQVTLIGMRLEQKIQGDRLQQLDDRIWKYEQRYGALLKSDKLQDQPIVEEYHRLLHERKELESQMKLLDERVMDMEYQRANMPANNVQSK